MGLKMTGQRRQNAAPVVRTQIDEGTTEGRENAKPRVTVTGVAKQFQVGKSAVHALHHVDLKVHQGEMVVLLGPSGCGKTTLLRSIAGLEKPTSGEIYIDDRCVFSASQRLWSPPEARDVGMVFQSYALWPHMSVFQNIAYPLECKHEPKEDIKTRVRAIMRAVDLADYADRLPAQLSGGQQQRVALARAIIGNVGLVLFDEPLSNVDAKVREQLRREIVRLQHEFGFAAIYVTHDQSEAGALADKLVVMRQGQIAEVGRPEDLYLTPRTRYVARFMGTSNEFEGRIVEREGEYLVLTAEHGAVAAAKEGASISSSDVVASFRPESCSISVDRPSHSINVWQCKVSQRMFMGEYTEYLSNLILTDGTTGSRVIFHTPANSVWEAGDIVWLHVPPASVRMLDA